MTYLKFFLPSLIETFRAGYDTTRLRHDVFGGLTAAVIALPLALAFGVASGAGPAAGLYGAIATGFFASLFGGTPTQITGPTGPMTVVVGAIIATHAGNLGEAFAIVTLGGLLQIVFGVLRVGRYVAYTPYSVVSGFMTGIGTIILIVQMLPFLGLPSAQGSIIESIRSLAEVGLADVNWPAALLATGALLAIVFWPARIGRIVPAPLAVLAIGTAITAVFLDGVPVIGEVPEGLPALALPSIGPTALPQILQAAFILALLGSIDTLLTSLVADSITKTQHDPDKELVGQGIGNTFAGLIGALPGAGATMRTLVNVRAGGRTPVAGMVHALCLLLLALGLGPIVAHVPHAILAAVLMKVGWDIIDWGYLRRMRRAPREKFFVMLVTFGLTVLVDLITAVAVGIILASFVNSKRLATVQVKGLRQSADPDSLDSLTPEEKTLLRPFANRILLTMLHGSFSYASARELARRDTQSTSPREVVIYDFSHADYIDTSAALAIDEMIDLSGRHGMRVMIAGLSGTALDALDGMGVLDRVPEAQRFPTRHEAIEAAITHCRSRDEPTTSTAHAAP